MADVRYSRLSNKTYVAYSMYPAFLFRPSKNFCHLNFCIFSRNGIEHGVIWAIFAPLQPQTIHTHF